VKDCRCREGIDDVLCYDTFTVPDFHASNPQQSILNHCALRETLSGLTRVQRKPSSSDCIHETVKFNPSLAMNAVVNCSCLWEEVSNSRAKHCGPVASVWPQRSRSVVEGQFSLSAIGLFLLPRSTMCHEICKLVWLRTKEPSMARIISCMQLV
jgi:hypothetical protein